MNTFQNIHFIVYCKSKPREQLIGFQRIGEPWSVWALVLLLFTQGTKERQFFKQNLISTGKPALDSGS